MPAFNLHYTTWSHDPKQQQQQQQQIDTDARLACVASLPTVNADNDVSSDDEEIAVYDDVSSSDDEEVAVHENVFVDDECVAVYDDVSSNNKKEAVDDEISSDNKEVAVDDEVSSDDEEVAVDNDEVHDSESNAETGEPDTSVLKLYHVLTALQSNPLELAWLSQGEQMYISLLQL